MPITIAFCPNDRNGIWTGKTESIDIDDNRFVGGGAISVNVGRNEDGSWWFRCGKVEIPALSFADHYGNIHGAAVIVRDIEARKIFNHLLTLKHWHCEEGEDDLYRRFEAKRPYTPTEWRDRQCEVSR